MIIISGKGVSRGAAWGKIRFISSREGSFEKRRISDIKSELSRFSRARADALSQLEELSASAQETSGSRGKEILDIQKAMLNDPDLCGKVVNTISSEEVNAEFAIYSAVQAFIEQLSQADDYFSQRAADLKDMAERLTGLLENKASPELFDTGECIICADDLSPAQTALLDRKKVLAFVTRQGSYTSHTAILARAMQIPAIIGAGGKLLERYDGEFAAVDAFSGKLIIRPDDNILDSLEKKKEELFLAKRLEQSLIGKENVTKDGRKIDIFANCSCLEDVEQALKNDAGGIGLFRSEFLFLDKDRFPSEDEQLSIYKAAVQKMKGRPVTIRTLDIGGDKSCKCLKMPGESNPALGWRAVRICLDRPDILRTQLRAVLRAGAFGKISVIFPMISSLWELKELKRLLASAKAELRNEGLPFDPKMPSGIMIETPAAALTSDILAREADLFSIGTNDLTQYTLAADRQNPRIDRFCDPKHPAVLRMIELTIKNAKKAGIPCGICGELASDTDMTGKFIAMGADILSVAPHSVLTVRKKVRETALSEIKKEDIPYENKTYRYGS